MHDYSIIHYLWSRKRFSPEAAVTLSYILLRLESDSERHTERAEQGRKVCLKCSLCQLKQNHAHVFYLPARKDCISCLNLNSRTEQPKIFQLS